MDERITFAIGDIHGCFEELRALLDICRSSAGDVAHDFLFLGDYVDRGPASDRVIAYLMREQANAPSQFRCLMGNHDQMLYRAADPDRSDADLIQWWANGGEQTLDAYGVEDASDLPAEHLAWLRALPLHISDGHRLFVHAGVRPGIALDAQSGDDMMWIREPFLSSELWHGALVVHGHTPMKTRAPDVRANRVNLDTGACFGGPLTAAAFGPGQAAPLFFVNSDGLRFELRSGPATTRTSAERRE
ncbi:serine/threonine protein phosphatase [Bradyrhizobium diazoefficiens]|nr:metallophosphoesterase family protein [Bradyrhizobium diazoefficiens]MBR0778918.1 serine/threonine protein phosphatase [Bradyrhizobium diazoefficiens]